MLIYGLKNCDTCRKALKALLGATLRDIRVEPLSNAEITAFLSAFPDTLINRRSTTWRTLSEADRATDPAALLQAHPALMKRPLIKAGETLFLGWSPDVQAAVKAAATGR